jgi:hypothetical protein
MTTGTIAIVTRNRRLLRHRRIGAIRATTRIIATHHHRRLTSRKGWCVCAGVSRL